MEKKKKKKWMKQFWKKKKIILTIKLKKQYGSKKNGSNWYTVEIYWDDSPGLQFNFLVKC